MTPSDRLADTAARYWTHLKTEQPFGAFIAGQLGDEAVLFRESPADHERRDLKAGRLLAELEAIPLDGLDRRDRITHRLLHRELSNGRAFYALGAHLRPSLLPVGPDFNTVFYANATTVTDADSAALHVERLSHFPAFLTDVHACLAEGYVRGIRLPRVILEASARATRSNLAAKPEDSPWHGPFRRSAVADQPAVRREAERAFALIETELMPALAAYADYIDGPLAYGARETLSCIDGPEGEQLYALYARHYTTTDLPPVAIHELGLAEVRRIEMEMVEIAGEAGFAGDLPGYRRFLTGDPRFIAANAETLREQIEVLCKRVDAKIPAFFRRVPRITYGVGVVPPEASASLPAAYAMPASPGGTTAGMFFVNGLPERCPSYIHPCLVVHEAWPGHLMHIGMIAELDDQPNFRRYNASGYTACVEGWALYCEQLGREMGVYRTPHDHYGRLEMEMWRACRLVVDTGIHLHDWSREQAIAFMVGRMTLDAGSIAAEVDRYAALPGQALAYQIGGLKFRELRARAETALGDSFDLRAYHEVVTTAGAVTLPVLEEVVDAWTAETAALEVV